jgi:hypothetical protein
MCFLFGSFFAANVSNAPKIHDVQIGARKYRNLQLLRESIEPDFYLHNYVRGVFRDSAASACFTSSIVRLAGRQTTQFIFANLSLLTSLDFAIKSRAATVDCFSNANRN